MTHPLSILTPIADWIVVTCVALVPLLVLHIGGIEVRVSKQRTALESKIKAQGQQMLLYEKFVINCLRGETLLVDQQDAVDCVKL